MRRLVACVSLLVIAGGLVGGVAEAQTSSKCAPNQVIDNTKSAQQGVNTKTGDIAAACENGKQYIVEKQTTSSTCRPTTLTISWQTGVNENTNPELLRKYPPKLFMKNLDGKVEDLGTGCPQGEDIEKLLTDPHAQSKLGLDEVARVDDVGEKVKLQQEVNKEFASAINKSFESAKASGDNQQLVDDLATQVNQAQSGQSSMENLVKLHSQATDVEAQLKASGANPQTIAQATALKTEVAALTRSQYTSLQRDYAVIDATADRMLLNPSYTPSQQVGVETFGSSLAKSDSLVPNSHGVYTPPVADWDYYYKDVGSLGATAIGTPAASPPVSSVPPLPAPSPVREQSVYSNSVSASSLPPAAMQATTLAQFYTAQSQQLPSFSERNAMVNGYGLSTTNYQGTASQNTILLCYLQGGVATSCGSF